MEPIPETSKALDDFGPFDVGEDDLLTQLKDRARRVQLLVPDCVGISLASSEHGVTFTLIASNVEIAALDGVQYLDGGPCVDGVQAERVLEYRDEELLNEANWHLFARATAAAAVASTLTLPIVVRGRVSGSVNLYAASSHAFTGKHEAIASIFDAWAPGAVANADLSFTTRTTAEQAPRLLYEEMRVHAAIGILVSAQNIALETARQRLRDAAQRAGVTEAQVAEALIAGIAPGDNIAD